MTEAEWLACTDPQPLLEFLRGKASDRKLRLFACACCRRYLHRMQDEASRNTVEVAERHADHLALPNELAAALDAAQLASAAYRAHLAGDNPSEDFSAPDAICVPASATDTEIAIAVFASAEVALAAAVPEEGSNDWGKALVTENATQCRNLRCIFGPLPFRPVAIKNAWQTSNVTALATAIYDDRAFDRMPILADALEDAGCDNADILNHCRSGEHVRGCWVVNLVLGKA